MARLTDQEVEAIARRVVAQQSGGRRPLIAGNWKMHLGPSQAEAFVAQLKSSLSGVACEVVIAPVFLCLERIGRLLKDSHIGVASQNAHWETQGAFTGEISCEMLSEIGVKYVIVGHSERRQYFAETDQTVNQRTRAVLRNAMTAIVCVGETLEQREASQTLQVVGRQLQQGLANIGTQDISRVVLAYEPVWAIGTGKVATSAQAQEVHLALRTQIAQIYGDAIAARIRILYGGSVKPDNAEELMQQGDIDGALVGGASLDAAAFTAICQATVAREAVG